MSALFQLWANSITDSCIKRQVLPSFLLLCCLLSWSTHQTLPRVAPLFIITFLLYSYYLNNGIWSRWIEVWCESRLGFSSKEGIFLCLLNTVLRKSKTTNTYTYRHSPSGWTATWEREDTPSMRSRLTSRTVLPSWSSWTACTAPPSPSTTLTPNKGTSLHLFILDYTVKSSLPRHLLPMYI